MLDEIQTNTEEATLDGLDSQESEESNSEKPKTYTESEHKKAIEDAISLYGAKIHQEKIAPIVKERDDFKLEANKAKKQLRDATEEVTEATERLAELESDLEVLKDENADIAEISKIRKRIADQETKLRKKLRDKEDAVDELQEKLERERNEWAETVAEAQTAKFEVDVFEVSEEYVDEAGKDITPERLKKLCEKAGVKKREDIQGLADVLWSKKGKEKAPVLEPDSAVSSGGSGKGRKPTVAELKATSPAEFDRKVKSGEWVL